MKYQILVKENIVMIDNTAINIDCSSFIDEFVFCEINEDEKWIEKKPFKGREDLESWEDIYSFIEIAKNTPPQNEIVTNKEDKGNSISRLQAKLYLLDSGYYDQVVALVEQDTRLQIYWNDAVNFNKNDLILKGVQVAIGLTDEQLDTMFLEASKL